MSTHSLEHPVLRYHGGKWKLALWIIQHFPPHTIYVEVFGGGAGVLLRKPPSPTEVYNDLDDEVVNFFRVLREQPLDLARVIAFTPYARAELEAAWEPTDDPLEAARRFAVRSWFSIGGPTAQWKSGFRYQRANKVGNQPLVQWNRLPMTLLEIAQRLKEVVIENADWRRILQRYDTPNTLFYCDPPYLGETRSRWGKFRKAYRHEFTEDDHRTLSETLRSVQGMVVISGYAHPLYTELYEAHGWVGFDRPTVNQNGRVVTERLWLNPKALRALQNHLPLLRMMEEKT